MRSNWVQWSDERRVQWETTGGATAYVLSPMFGGETVQNDDGSWTPREFTYVELPRDQNDPYFVMECEYSPEDLVPRVTAVHAIQRNPEREVRSVDMRSISIEAALEEAWLHVTRHPRAILPDDTPPAERLLVPVPPSRKTYRGLRAGNRRKMTAELLREVADVYTGAVGSGAPTKAVKEHFGLATSTASLYVKRAREAGLLPPFT